MASRRKARPHEARRREPPARRAPSLASCPFCPGNERETTVETFRQPGSDDREWRTRAVLNKYPALTSQGGFPRIRRNGLKVSVNAYGIHEVIVETPRHDLTTAQLSPQELCDVLATYRSRYRALSSDPNVALIIIFKNHGERAGTSLTHPHSQLITTPVVPAQVQARLQLYGEHFETQGGCIICQVIAEELADQIRILHENEHFVAFIPFAALSSFHTWIMPKRHMVHFGDLRDAEMVDLADTLRAVLRMLYFALDDPAYNFVIRSAPMVQSDFHWYLSIIPRVTQAAGFEMGSGMYINATPPEESAALLRAADISEGRS